MMEYSTLNHYFVPEEIGGTRFFPNYQSNTDISFSNFLLLPNLLPNKLSIDHRTYSVFENDGLGDGIFFVELNCSIFFPLYCLIVSKKTDDFLREIVRLEILL